MFVAQFLHICTGAIGTSGFITVAFTIPTILGGSGASRHGWSTNRSRAVERTVMPV
jgi:hypothetical protein